MTMQLELEVRVNLNKAARAKLKKRQRRLSRLPVGGPPGRASAALRRAWHRQCALRLAGAAAGPPIHCDKPQARALASCALPTRKDSMVNDLESNPDSEPRGNDLEVASLSAALAA